MLASILLASWLSTQEWSWDKVIPSTEVPVTGYRIYYSTQPTLWCTSGRVEVPTSQCDPNVVPPPAVPRCWGETPEVPGDVVFFTVVAYNDAGESPTDHGVVQTCP